MLLLRSLSHCVTVFARLLLGLCCCWGTANVLRPCVATMMVMRLSRQRLQVMMGKKLLLLVDAIFVKMFVFCAHTL